MDNNVDIRDMQNAADFIIMKRELTFSGILEIILGLSFIMLFGKYEPLLRKLPAIIGVILVIIGIISIVKPSPVIKLINHVVLISLLYLNITASESFGSKIVWTCILVTFIIKLIESYKNFRKKVPQKPTPEAMALIYSIVKDVRTRDASAFDDIIEMNYHEKMKWRVLLGKNAVIFVRLSDSKVFIWSRGDDAFTLKSHDRESHTASVLSKATGNLEFKMSEEHYQRYLAWKGISTG